MVRRRASQPYATSGSALRTLGTAARPLMVAGKGALRRLVKTSPGGPV